MEVEVEVDGRQRSRSFRSILAFLNIPVLCDNILSTRSALFQFTSGAGFSGANAHKSRSLHFISVQSSVEFLRKTPEPFTNHFNSLFWHSKDANDPRGRLHQKGKGHVYAISSTRNQFSRYLSRCLSRRQQTADIRR